MRPVKPSDLATHSSWFIVITSHSRAKQPKNKKGWLSPPLVQRKKICLPDVGEGMQLGAAFAFAPLNTLMYEQTNFEFAVEQSLSCLKPEQASISCSHSAKKSILTKG